MSRGKKYSQGEREKVFALWADGESISAISKKLKIPYSTVKGWIDSKEPDEFEELREEKARARAREFIEQADSIIDTGLALLKKRFERALKREEELDELIETIWKNDEDDMSFEQKRQLVKKVRELQLQDVKAVTVAIGTLYDKRALTRGTDDKNNPKGVIILPEIKENEEEEK